MYRHIVFEQRTIIKPDVFAGEKPTAMASQRSLPGTPVWPRTYLHATGAAKPHQLARQIFPQVAVGDIATLGIFPATRTPRPNPLGDATNDISRVGIKHDGIGMRSFERAQSLQSSIISMRLLVVSGSLPPSSRTLPSGVATMAAQPPGPGLPVQARAENNSRFEVDLHGAAYGVRGRLGKPDSIERVVIKGQNPLFAAGHALLHAIGLLAQRLLLVAQLLDVFAYRQRSSARPSRHAAERRSEALRETNEALAEKARLLSEQKRDIEVKNEEIELARRGARGKGRRSWRCRRSTSPSSSRTCRTSSAPR